LRSNIKEDFGPDLQEYPVILSRNIEGYRRGFPLMDKIERIAVLRNEVEARLLDAELAEDDIPHFIKSYYDGAFDGVYQFSKGWGHVEAPSEFRDRILEILAGIRSGSSNTEDDSIEDADDGG
jgi:hypothetical protein